MSSCQNIFELPHLDVDSQAKVTFDDFHKCFLANKSGLVRFATTGNKCIDYSNTVFVNLTTEIYEETQTTQTHSYLYHRRTWLRDPSGYR